MMTKFLSRARAIPLLLALALTTTPLGACSQVQQAWQKVETAAAAVSGTKINRKAVFVAANAVNGAIVAADIYLQQPICGTGPAVCRTPAATEPIIRAATTAKIARNAMLRFMREHPAELGDRGLYDAMVAAGDALSQALAVYNVKIK